MNIHIQGLNSAIFGGGIRGGYPGLKSTQQKLERQATRDNQVEFYEKQKENLKNLKCETVEEIAAKLDMFHKYEDQIAAAKAAYNSEQMWHIMDEAREIGEKIAEAAEKTEPKTAEERQEDLVEEALGMDETKGALSDMLDEVAKMQEELQEGVQDALQENVQDTLQEELQESAQDTLQEELEEAVEGGQQESMEETVQEELQELSAGETVAQKIIFYEEGLRKEGNDPI